MACERIQAGLMQGYLAYVDGSPVGWCNAAPRTLLHALDDEPIPDAAQVGSIVCFLVEPSHRGRGVAKRLLEAACEGLRKQGLRIAEGNPRNEATSNAENHFGPLSLYLSAGFTVHRTDNDGVCMFGAPCEAARMHLSRSQLLLIAVPAVAASMAVLTFGAVGRSTWIIQVLAICLACALALVGAQLSRRTNARSPAGPIIVFTLLGIAVPFLAEAPGPERWASLGPINLYMAPALLPSFLVACSVWIARGGDLSISRSLQSWAQAYCWPLSQMHLRRWLCWPPQR
jgi:GNAT superfamily N-acetyltransferase